MPFSCDLFFDYVKQQADFGITELILPKWLSELDDKVIHGVHLYTEPASRAGYKNKEAFCWLLFICPKGHMYHVYNSRDGRFDSTVNCYCGETACWTGETTSKYSPYHQLRSLDLYFRDGTKKDVERFIHKFGSEIIIPNDRVYTSTELLQFLANGQLPHFTDGWPILDLIEDITLLEIPKSLSVLLENVGIKYLSQGPF